MTLDPSQKTQALKGPMFVPVAVMLLGFFLLESGNSDLTTEAFSLRLCFMAHTFPAQFRENQMAEDFVSAFAKFIQEQGGTVVEVAAVEKSVEVPLSLLEDMVEFIDLYKNTVDYYSKAHPDSRIAPSNLLGLIGAKLLLIGVQKAIEAGK